MQTMRYINLLDRASHVKTSNCFVYNNTIFFAVPAQLVSKAIGPAANHTKNLQEKLGRKIRIIREPRGEGDIDRFVKSVVEPIRFKSLEVRDDAVVITAGGKQSKASLIGRDKKRLDELRLIVSNLFKRDVQII